MANAQAKVAMKNSVGEGALMLRKVGRMEEILRES